MATVSSEIKRVIKEKDAGILSGTEAMHGILEDLRQQVQRSLDQAAQDSWDAYQGKQMLNSIEYQISNYQSKAKAEAAGMLEEIWGVGRNLVDMPLQQAGIFVGFNLSTSSLDVLKDYTNTYLEGVFGDAWMKVKGEITLGVMGAKTPAEVAAAIGRNLKDKSIFASIAERAEAITQTEMGRAFSQATQFRMAQAAAYVPELMKEWKHVGHPKQPRPTHVRADGQRVAVKDMFNVGGVKMMFPRDPAAPVSEVIRCGCDHVPYKSGWD